MGRNNFERGFGVPFSTFEPHRETTPITDTEVFDGFSVPSAEAIDVQRRRVGTHVRGVMSLGSEFVDFQFHGRRMAKFPHLVDYDYSMLDRRE